MVDIDTYGFEKDELSSLKDKHFCSNWPVVYLLEGKKELYVGETISLYNRAKQHYKKKERQKLEKVHLISDEEYNKSAALDIESWLIQYFSAEGKYTLQNSNKGLQNHEYFDREKYKSKFEMIWEELRKMSIAEKTLHELRNSDLFKYSPYKSLTKDQFEVVHDILDKIKDRKKSNTFLVHGKPGTGKTIVATYLVKYLVEQLKQDNLSIGLVIPMTSLRKTIQKVFKQTKNLYANMVISANEAVSKHYDVLIVDEAHRLKRRRNITNYKAFDDTNKKLALGNEGDQLDWILQSSSVQIFMYDANQSVKPTDVRPGRFDKLQAYRYELQTQMRIEGGQKYLNMVDNIFEKEPVEVNSFDDYEFKLFDDIREFRQTIYKRDHEYGLSRIVAGYAWDWKTKSAPEDFSHDIEINGEKFIWNTTNKDWVNSENALYEVGCIHTIQGYDLNYVGVIIGHELSYDFAKGEFVVKKENYYDKNGKRGIKDPEELKRYIINIYKTLLTRGIKGTFIYIVDDNLREYFKRELGDLVKS